MKSFNLYLIQNIYFLGGGGCLSVAPLFIFPPFHLCSDKLCVSRTPLPVSTGGNHLDFILTTLIRVSFCVGLCVRDDDHDHWLISNTSKILIHFFMQILQTPSVARFFGFLSK